MNQIIHLVTDHNSEHKIVKRMCAKISQLTIKYLPVKDNIIKGFQIIDIRNWNIKNSVSIFRYDLLKNFVNVYKKEDYPLILTFFKIY